MIKNLNNMTTAKTIYSDTTITVAVSGGMFTSVQAALDSLAAVQIAGSAFVTIEIGDGTYASSEIAWPTAPQYARVKIKGKNKYTANMTSIVSSSGTVGDYSLILQLVSVVNILVGDFIYIPTTVASGTNPTAMEGCFKVTNVDSVNSRITVYCKLRNSAYLPSGAVTCTLTVIKAVLSMQSSSGIVLLPGCVLQDINDVVISGGTTGVGIAVGLSSSITSTVAVYVNGFTYGITANGNTTLGLVGCSNASGPGISVKGSLQVTTGSISANAYSGVLVVGGEASTAQLHCVQNTNDGISVSGGWGSIAGVFSYNTHNGVAVNASGGGQVFSSVCSYNAWYGLQVTSAGGADDYNTTYTGNVMGATNIATGGVIV